MAANQKRLVTAPSSKLAKVDLVSILRRDDAWILLPPETRERLYALLPEPKDGQAPPDPDIHPLHTVYKTFIEEEIRRFREDLKEGREQKKWRDEAMQAGRDRIEGKFDEWKEAQRQEYWGKADVEKTEVDLDVQPNGEQAKGSEDGLEDKEHEEQQ